MQIRRFYKLKQCWFKVLLLSQKEKKIRSLMIHGQRAQMRCGAELAANLRKKITEKVLGLLKVQIIIIYVT